jgi:hypothetical protein
MRGALPVGVLGHGLGPRAHRGQVQLPAGRLDLCERGCVGGRRVAHPASPSSAS